MVTTVVAAMGRHVVAVDPMKEHLSYLHRALELLGNEGNVRLLNNAVRYLTLFLMGGQIYSCGNKHNTVASVSLRAYVLVVHG